MKAQVYHCPDHLSRDVSCIFAASELAGFITANSPSYEHVADVEVADDFELEWQLEEAYTKTNSVQDGWVANEGVQAYKWPCRSTSKGDFVVLEDGAMHAVASVGFIRVPVVRVP